MSDMMIRYAGPQKPINLDDSSNRYDDYTHAIRYAGPEEYALKNNGSYERTPDSDVVSIKKQTKPQGFFSKILNFFRKKPNNEVTSIERHDEPQKPTSKNDKWHAEIRYAGPEDITPNNYEFDPSFVDRYAGPQDFTPKDDKWHAEIRYAGPEEL